jgi:hypothetical protein
MAAVQNHVMAQDNLGMVYMRGEGVPKDVVMAYKWASLAAKGGWARAERRQREIAMELSAAQLRQALQLVSEFKPQRPTKDDEEAFSDPVGSGGDLW